MLDYIAKRVKYNNDGTITWIYLDRRKDLIGKQAGTIGTKGYAYVKCNGKRTPVHRVVWFIHHGESIKNLDHINGNSSDNRIENLRKSTQQENLRNRCANKKGTSIYKGVCLTRGKWKAASKINGRSIYLGLFSEEKDAAHAYNKFAKEHFGEFAKLNDLGVPIKFKD